MTNDDIKRRCACGFEASEFSSGMASIENKIGELRVHENRLPENLIKIHIDEDHTKRWPSSRTYIYSLGNANDISGYGNNGTPINGPIFIPNACMDTCTIAISSM